MNDPMNLGSPGPGPLDRSRRRLSPLSGARGKIGLCVVKLAAVALALSAAWPASGQVQVFAAASLNDSLKEIASRYQTRTGEKIAFNFGASSFLARQITEGAPADIFFSADEAKMDQLEAKGLIIQPSRQSRLSNSLVIVTETRSGLSIRSAADLAGPGVKRLALADPQTVPAGIYAKLYLEKLGLWPAIRPKVVPMDNVRATLAAVESGNVEAGMVYKTDAAISKKVKVTCEIPPAEGPAISYSMALLKEAPHLESARRFFQELQSEDASRIFARYGFIARGPP